MKALKQIIENLKVINQPNDLNPSVEHLTFDSRKVKLNTLFFAVKGTLVNGHSYISKAIDKGAVAIICEDLPEKLSNDVVYLQVSNTQEAMAAVAHQFFDKPSQQLKLVGVTGTNGKTTIATLLHQLFTQLGYPCGLISTVKVLVGQQEFISTHTTPDSITINTYLRKMVDLGCEFAFMEVSSHGIDQKRIQYLEFKGGVFTNLSHDHLDYHQDFASYRDVKKVFFDDLSKDSFVVSNADDKNGNFMLQNTLAKKVFYGIKNVADVQVRILEKMINGMLLVINKQEIWTQLIGAFNASNIAAIYSTSIELGVSEDEVLLGISKLKSVAGRFQYIENEGKVGIVDYAHTPDALDNVLQTLKDLQGQRTKVITVVGCGGDRDKTKRPKMAEIAIAKSDFVILTSDNPRTENPEEILNDMEKGIDAIHTKKYIRIADREQAIKMACQMLNEKDIILIAGKGHETYQEIQGIRNHFDDLEQLKKYL